MGQQSTTNTLQKKHRPRHWMRRSILLILLVYLCVATLPYTRQTASADLPADWRSSALSSSNVDSAAILETGGDALDIRLRLIANAQESIRAGTYLYAMDESGTLVTAALLNAADRGVNVQLIIDGLFGFLNLRFHPYAYVLGSHPNVEICFYNPVDLTNPVSLNVRYHEKFFAIDDEWLILGGRNISDEFLSQEGNPHYNYDRDILIHNDHPGISACGLVAEYFDAMWASGLCQSRYNSVPEYKKGAVIKATEDLHNAWHKIETTHDLSLPDYSAFHPVEKSILLSGSIDAGPKEPLVYAQMMDLMMDAQQRVILQSPYFVMDSAMRDALEKVCDLPIQTTLITNSAASGNNLIASADGVFHRGMTNRMDAIVLEQQTEYSMHTKSVLIDDNLSIFGSFNVDPRSAYIDTELMLAVYSKPLAAELDGYMNALVQRSNPVSAQAKAIYPARGAQPIPFFKAMAIYLLSPIISLFRYLA